MRKTNSPRPKEERRLEELLEPTTTNSGMKATATDRREGVSTISSPEVLNLDIRDLAQRKALSTKDAVETEIGLIRTIRILELKLRRMSRAYLESGEGAPEIRDISAIALTIQRAATAYSRISIVNSTALDELRSIAESLSSADDDETLEKLVRHYVLVKDRVGLSVGALKRGEGYVRRHGDRNASDH